MKLTLLLLLFTATCLAQDIPKGATAIVLTTTIGDSVLFEKTISLLNANEFVVDKADLRYGTIVTQNRASAGAMNMRILVSLKSGVATFKGQWSAQLGGYSFTNESVRFKGMVGSNGKKSFLVLNDVVVMLSKEVNGSSLSYLLP